MAKIREGGTKPRAKRVAEQPKPEVKPVQFKPTVSQPKAGEKQRKTNPNTKLPKTQGGNLQPKPENFRPLNQLSPEERSRISKLGSMAVEANRAKRKSFRESMTYLLGIDLSDRVVKQKLESRGVDASNMQYVDAINMGLIQRAMGGDVNAAREARIIVGEYGVEEPVGGNAINLTIKRAAVHPEAEAASRPQFDDDDELEV